MLGPRKQTWVTVVTMRRGTIIIEHRSSLATTHLVSATNGVATVKPDIPFCLLVANFGDRTVRIHKGQIIAHAMTHPPYTVQTEACLANVLGINLKEAPIESGKLSINKPKEKNPTGAEQDTGMLTQNRKSLSVYEIPLNEVEEE